MIKVVLFDLDGTLLPMDEDEFKKVYFGAVYNKVKHFGYKVEDLINAIWFGTKAMYKNDGTMPNEERFWEAFSTIYPESRKRDEYYFNDFYHNDFPKLAFACAKPVQPLAKVLVDELKKRGYKLIIASNPIFPIVATKARIAWAGCSPNDFIDITAYENSGFCKPNLKYYEMILERNNLKPEEVIMVGNDVREDMAVNKLGIDSYLITDCLLNLDNEDINKYKHGNFEEVMNMVLERLK